MEIKQLFYFLATCRTEPLGSAAEKLNIAVSTLSQSLKALEEEVGLELFSRDRSGLKPIEGARVLIAHAASVLRLENFARRAVAAKVDRIEELVVDLCFDFSNRRVGDALERSYRTLAGRRPGLFVRTAWANLDVEAPPSPAIDKSAPDRRIMVTLATSEVGHESTGVVAILADRWVFVQRRGGEAPIDPSSARIIVPALPPVLRNEAEAQLAAMGVSGARFVDETAWLLSDLVARYPEAIFLLPEGFVGSSLRTKSLHVVPVVPSRPLSFVAHYDPSDELQGEFMDAFRAALDDSDGDDWPEPPELTSKQVRYFMSMHRLGSMSGAAVAANVSQPALSEQLTRLEGILGTPLFRRERTGLVGTDAGETFAKVAAALEECVRPGAFKIDGAVPTGRRLALGILPSVSPRGFLITRVTEAVLSVRKRYPNLRLTVQEAPNGTLQDWVMRGVVGIAVVETSLPQMARLPLQSSENLSVIAHARHDKLPSGPVEFDALVRLPLVLPSKRYGLRQLMDETARGKGVVLKPSLEVDTLAMTGAILAHEEIYAVLPASAVPEELRAGELVMHPIVNPTLSRRLFVIHSAERSLTHPERSFIEELRRGLAGGGGTAVSLDGP